MSLVVYGSSDSNREYKSNERISPQTSALAPQSIGNQLSFPTRKHNIPEMIPTQTRKGMIPPKTSALAPQSSSNSTPADVHPKQLLEADLPQLCGHLRRLQGIIAANGELVHVVKQLSFLFTPFKKLSLRKLSSEDEQTLFREIEKVKNAMMGKVYYIAKEKEIRALFNDFFSRQTLALPRLSQRVPVELARLMASFLPANEILPFLLSSKCENWPQHVATIVNSNKIPLAALRLSDQQLQAVCPHLTYVDTEGLENTSKVLESCKKMQSLIFPQNSKTPLAQINSLVDKAKVAAPNLSRVACGMRHVATFEEEINDFLNKWPQKRIGKLEITSNPNLTPKSAKVVAPYLTQLHLWRPNAKALEILKLCTQLEGLTCSWDEGDTNEISSFGESLACPNLRHLCVKNWKNLEGLPPNLSLEVLSVENCVNLKKWPEIHKHVRDFVYLHNCPSIEDGQPPYYEFFRFPSEFNVKAIMPPPGVIVNGQYQVKDANDKILSTTADTYCNAKGQWFDDGRLERYKTVKLVKWQRFPLKYAKLPVPTFEELAKRRLPPFVIKLFRGAKEQVEVPVKRQLPPFMVKRLLEGAKAQVEVPAKQLLSPSMHKLLEGAEEQVKLPEQVLLDADPQLFAHLRRLQTALLANEEPTTLLANGESTTLLKKKEPTTLLKKKEPTTLLGPTTLLANGESTTLLANEEPTTLDKLNERLKQYPGDIESRLNRAAIFTQKKLFSDAKVDYEYVIQKYPANEEAAEGLEKIAKLELT